MSEKILTNYVVQRDWETPKVSLKDLKNFGAVNPLLNIATLKEKAVITPTPPKSEDIKTSIDRVLKGPIAEAKTASDLKMTGTVTDGKYADGTTVAGETEWNNALDEVIAYLTKKL